MSAALHALIEDRVGVPGIKLTLDRMLALLAAIDNPQLKLPPVIHVAGTNGKGSTVAYLRAIYEAAGKKVHTYTSPHLVHYNERVILAGQEVSDMQFASAIQRVRTQEHAHSITLFERITAAAFICFSEVKADVLILETGLGGQWDATNTTPKIATVLTPIAHDHMEFLGDNLANIALEKASIMRRGVPSISAQQSPVVKKVIEAHAQYLNAPLYWSTRDDSLRPSLVGTHQQDNASLAATVARMLKLPEDAIHAGVANTVWRGRLQKLNYGLLVDIWGSRGDVMLDGGHNPHAAEALVGWIKGRARPVTLVCGMMKRKNALDWMHIMIPHVQEIICLPMADVGAYTVAELVENATFAGASNVSSVASVAELAQVLRGKPVTDAHILIAGSLYLAGAILKSHG